MINQIENTLEEWHQLNLKIIRLIEEALRAD